MVLTITTCIDMQHTLVGQDVEFKKEYMKRRMQEVASCGGDASINCSVVGVLIGLYVGYDCLPTEWLSSVESQQWNEDMIQRLEKFL